MPVRLALSPPDWERLAPIALPRKKPVAEFIIDRALAEAALFQPLGDFSKRVTRWESIDNRRIDCDPVADESDRIFVPRRLNNLAHRQIELAREFQIALVMGRNSLNCAGAVTEQNVIRDPDRDFFFVRGIDRECAGEDAGFFLRELGAFKIALARRLFSIFAT